MPRLYEISISPDQIKRYAPYIPYKYYECMIMNAEGDAYADIAKQLAIPVGTVKSRISRGRVKYKRLEENRINEEKAAQRLREEASVYD